MLKILSVFLIFLHHSLAQICSEYKDCTACAQSNECGWCFPSAQCIDGNPFGPKNATLCNWTNFAWKTCEGFIISHVIVSLITGWIVFGVIVSVIILSTIGMIVVFKIRKIRMKSKERKGSFVKMVDTMNVVKSNPNISNNMKEMRRE